MTKNDRIYVTRADKITHRENNLVTLTLASGESYDSLEPRRLFPVSRRDSYVTLLNKDGAEVAVIRAISELDKESCRVVCESLDDYYLVPHITKIVAITEKYGTLHWSVETDRGHKEFDIRNRNHDVKGAKDGSVRVRDSDDNRYVIEDYRALDKSSRAYLISDL